jgi:coenzyme F420-reducing hydrogenase delta subunit
LENVQKYKIKEKKDNLKDIMLAQPRCQNLFISTTATDNKLVMVMGNVVERVEVGK